MSHRQPLVAANWKMNGTLASIRPLIREIIDGLQQGVKAEVAICPPFVYLDELARLLKGTGIELGVQNLSQHAAGAHTGEVSAGMLKDYNCRFVIVGHSERRTHYGETDGLVAEKFTQAVKSGLAPVLCVGEYREEREADETEIVVARQLDAVVNRAGIAAFAEAVIAYEPVWAIGTGRNATPEQAQEVHAFIRLRLARHDDKVANTIRILYGGSVNAANAAELFKMADIDGGLIGGASLDANEFLAICRTAT
jgi:triosephosphate isomerase (TIM)